MLMLCYHGVGFGISGENVVDAGTLCVNLILNAKMPIMLMLLS
jgi:hypothetical protein